MMRNLLPTKQEVCSRELHFKEIDKTNYSYRLEHNCNEVRITIMYRKRLVSGIYAGIKYDSEVNLEWLTYFSSLEELFKEFPNSNIKDYQEELEQCFMKLIAQKV
jgi:hypothetical protein